MNSHGIMLIGGPDSGKTNFLARLWEALRASNGAVVAPSAPADVKYVEEALAHLLQGTFAPRSDKGFEENGQSFSIPIMVPARPASGVFEIVVPDVSGELWKGAVEKCELPQQWMDTLNAACGALLFIRVGSDQNADHLDWVNTAALIKTNSKLGFDQPTENRVIPTQVSMCELMRYLEHGIGEGLDSKSPKVAILITAWDRLDPETAAKGPLAYLQKEYPLFAGKLGSLTRIDAQAFGVSIVGGDFIDEKFTEQFFQTELKNSGYVVVDTDQGPRTDLDLTVPVAWVFGGLI